MKKIIIACAFLISIHNLSQASHNAEYMDTCPWPSKKDLSEKCTYPQNNDVVINILDNDMFIYEPGYDKITIPLKKFHKNAPFCSSGSTRLDDQRIVIFTLRQSSEGHTYFDKPKIKNKSKSDDCNLCTIN